MRVILLSLAAAAVALTWGAWPPRATHADVNMLTDSMMLPVGSLSTWHICDGPGHQPGTATGYAIDIMYGTSTCNGSASAGRTVVSPIYGKVAKASGYVCGRPLNADEGVIIDGMYSDGTLTGHRITLLHINRLVSAGTIVKEGQAVGTIKDYGSCSHLHINHSYNGVSQPLKLAGRTYSAGAKGTKVRNNALTSSPIVSGQPYAGLTYIGLKDPNLNNDPVGDNNAEGAVVNYGCTMRLYNNTGYSGTLKDLAGGSTNYDLNALGVGNRTSSLSVYNCTPG